MLKKHLLSVTICTLTALSLQPSSNNIYHLITPQILKGVNFDQPTTADQDLINATIAFSKHESHNYNNFNPENLTTVNSVNLICDILPKYIQTSTISGKIQAACLATQITSDISELQKRQTFVSFLHHNPRALNFLQEQLQNAAAGERGLFSIYQPVAESKQLEVEMTKFRSQYSSKYFQACNNEPILEIGKRMKLIALSPIVMVPLSYAYIVKVISISDGISFAQAAQALNNLAFSCISSQNPKALLPVGVTAAYAGYNCYSGAKEIIEDLNIIAQYQKDLMGLAKTIKSITKICSLIKDHPELLALVDHDVATMSELFNKQSTVTSDNLKYVISQLLTSSFEGEPSYYFSRQGKILATHYWLEQCKEEFMPYLAALGNIDAYVSAAQLYADFEHNEHVSFCLPTFVDQARPTLDIQGYWHPLIDLQVVVPNNLDLAHGAAQNIIITGPNAGGKTTSLMSLIINIVFAQTFGIAPSSKLTMTPFAKIHSYLDITTNLQEGLSLFAAEVDRAKKLKQSILSCTPEEKTFTIIDEIFSGTNPTVASDVGLKFIQQLADMKHSMAIITTHFPQLTEIEKMNNSFTNYKVADATVMPDGTIVYPFKLVPGISTQNIAQQMLLQQGVI